MRRLTWALLRTSLLGVVCLLAARPGTAVALPADSLRVRGEFGLASDVSNEIFYEDSYTDTTFLGRRLRSTPETKNAAVGLVELAGSRSSLAYRAVQELSYGDRVQRGALSLFLRSEASPDWKLSFDPRAELRHDETFGRDLHELRAGGTARARRLLGDGESALELGGATDFLRSSGSGSRYVLDRNAGGGHVQLSRAGFSGPEWRVRYGLDARAFPDSIQRDHLEQRAELGFRADGVGGLSLTTELAASRRTTLHDAPTSRDRFSEGRAEIQWSTPPAHAATWIARVELQATAYDDPDSALYFDYQTYRARVGPRLEIGSGASLWFGPHAEWLRAGLESENYAEFGGTVEWEGLWGGAWWSLVPSAGWRDYPDTRSAGGDGTFSHSPYAFYEAQCIGDQPLPGRMRLRAIATGRIESHVDHSQDARSLYLSVDVRRLF